MTADTDAHQRLADLVMPDSITRESLRGYCNVPRRIELLRESKLCLCRLRLGRLQQNHEQRSTIARRGQLADYREPGLRAKIYALRLWYSTFGAHGYRSTILSITRSASFIYSLILDN